MSENRSESKDGDFFTRPDWYDRGINWQARIEREIPVLVELFGKPGDGGLLDAGCGPGHQAIALAKRGYHVTGLDADAGMLELATEYARRAGVALDVVAAPSGSVNDATGGGFDGVYSLGNALAATGERESCRNAFLQLAASLRPAGVFFAQVLNFRKLRNDAPCVRGPRVVLHDGIEYVSVRHFGFSGDKCTVTNATLWKDDSWRQWSRSGTLYPVDVDEVRDWCGEAGLSIEAMYGSYARDSFDPDTANDLIVVAARTRQGRSD